MAKQCGTFPFASTWLSCSLCPWWLLTLDFFLWTFFKKDSFRPSMTTIGKMYTFQHCKTLHVDLVFSPNLHCTNNAAVHFGDTSHSLLMVISRQRSLFGDWQLLPNLDNIKRLQSAWGSSLPCCHVRHKWNGADFASSLVLFLYWDLITVCCRMGIWDNHSLEESINLSSCYALSSWHRNVVSAVYLNNFNSRTHPLACW